MANFAATDTFSDVVVLETTDQVLGGLPSSPSNKQAQALVNRTEWLKKRIGNKEVVVRTLGAMDTLSLSNDIGKLVIVDSNSSNSVRDFPIVIGSSGKVNGSTVTVYFRPNDTTLLIGTTSGGVRYFSGDLVEFIFDGTSFIGNIIHRNLNKGSIEATTYAYGSDIGITLPSISNDYHLQSGLLSNIVNIQLQGENYPETGTVITILNTTGAEISIKQPSSLLTGSIYLRNIGVTYNGESFKSYKVKAYDYVSFVFDGNFWAILENSISEYPLNGIIPSGNIELPTATYPSLRNWINQLIETIDTIITSPSGYLLFGGSLHDSFLDYIEIPDTEFIVSSCRMNFVFGNHFNLHGAGKAIPPSGVYPNLRPTTIPSLGGRDTVSCVIIKGGGFYYIDFKVKVKATQFDATVKINIYRHSAGVTTSLDEQELFCGASSLISFDLSYSGQISSVFMKENDEIFIGINVTSGSAAQVWNIVEPSLYINAEGQ